MPEQQRILTGMRPTGQLHLGHYLGALENWIQMQHEYECFFLIADYQAMGDHLDDIGLIRRSVLEWPPTGWPSASTLKSPPSSSRATFRSMPS